MTGAQDDQRPPNRRPPHRRRALSITTCQAANTEPAVRAVARYLSEDVGRPVHVRDDVSWRERERELDAGRIDVGWVCSAWYVQKKAAHAPGIRLLAAPVMRGDRYAGRPVYFSDVVVRRDSAFHTFDDLQGATWAYNEPHSYSGRYVLLHRLAAADAGPDFFGDVVQSGGHVNSLALILDGRADTAAVDSTVLDYEQRRRPALEEQLRVLETLGPSPIPPWAVFSSLPADLEKQLRALLLHMHETDAGRAALAAGDLARFVPAEDADYDFVRSVLATVGQDSRKRDRR